MLRKLLLATVVIGLLRTVGSTPKGRSTENRLNAAMPRIPWPQPYDGPANNSSYPYGQFSYQSGNGSYNIGDGSYNVSTAWNAAAYPGDNGGATSGQIGGASAHYHDMSHGHNYGNLANDFNALRNSHAAAVSAYNTARNAYSDTVTAFNNHVNDYQSHMNAFNTLRASHSSLLDAHNNLMFKLNSANILQ